ncbi:MAG TPA: ShlB/FhaC/HecB family hemolysin secretion/activation protein [Steroidobacteraceae bacterium]|nr:ShlB/FhaC/HecB family hemolysin secretion/activation protein [Steroidobacteraceae bacterium]
MPPTPAYTLPVVPDLTSESTPAATGVQIFIKRIEVRGVTAFRSTAIADVTAPYENRIVARSELQTLRIALTRLYVDKGFINSGVVLPDQESKDGLVIFQAIEGSLDRVDVAGKSNLNNTYITWRIRSHVGNPLSIADLQYALRYLQADPNVLRLDARFGPGDKLGQGVLNIKVEEQPRFSVGVGADNHHSSVTGANEGTAFFGVRDLTGYADELRGSVVRARGDTEGSIIFSIPVAPNNASFQTYYSRSSAGIIEQTFQTLHIKETTRTYGLSLNIPLQDRLTSRVTVFVGGESDRSSTELLGTPFSFSPGAQNGVSAVAVALGGVDWVLHGKSSVTDFRLSYKRGLNALGATISSPGNNIFGFNPNPTGADGRFGLEQLQFIFVQRLNDFSAWSRLNDRAQLMVRASGQITQQPLLLLEKFTIGGVDTVRGFPENLLVKDNGMAATVELQLPVPGYRADPNPRNLAVAAFVDYGRSWDKVNADRSNPLVNTTDPLYIASVGLGLLWNPFPGFGANLYWARGIANNFHGADDPLAGAPNDLQKRGLHFAVNYVCRW